MTMIDMPNAGSIYRNAIVGLTRSRRTTELPERVLRVADVRVNPDALAAYQRVCGFLPANTLPATYPHVLAFPIAMHLMNAPDFPFRVIGLVHVANVITQIRPVATTECMTFTVSAVNLRAHDRGRQFDVLTVGAIEGIEVWRGISTYLRRETATAAVKHGAAQRPNDIPDDAPNDSARWDVGREVGRAYARVSGDRNPIHTSSLGAKLFGFRRPIAHGMWSAARCLAEVEGDLADAYAFDVVFKRPILLPSTVAFARRGSEMTLTDAKSGIPHLAATLKS